MKHILSTSALLILSAAAASAAQVRIDFSNNAPSGGVGLTPLWVGFHDGGFDNFTVGGTTDAGLERIAEDGTVGARSADFLGTAGRVDGAIASSTAPPPPLLPGSTGSIVLTLAEDGSNSLFSYASMVLPSSDYFIGNSTALDISSVFTSGSPLTFTIGGTVWDAGTEVNDFDTSAANPLFGFSGGQPGGGVSDLGTAENGVITAVTAADAFGGFANTANGPGGAVPANFNFNDSSIYTNPDGFATVTFTVVPEPGTALLAGFGVLGMALRRRR